MTILNIENDGCYPELIVLAQAVHLSKKIDASSLYKICSPPNSNSDPDEESKDKKLRGSLNRWKSMGLFKEENGFIKINYEAFGDKKLSTDDFMDQLPLSCRRLVFKENNSLPLFSSEPNESTEKDSGLTADFSRGLAWLLAQNIYSLPTTWANGVNSLHDSQVAAGKKLIQNDTRWTALRHWARYLGFATGDGNSFKVDPTTAILSELPSIFKSHNDLPADVFLQKLSIYFPVLDFGEYRQTVESNLDETIWHKPKERHLSMSLSFALQRLHVSKTIALEGKADAGSSYLLTSSGYSSWTGFEHVRLLGSDK